MIFCINSASISLFTLLGLYGLYEERLKQDKLSHLKLVDRDEIKKQLKDKLLKEHQGFRTRPSCYKSLLVVEKNTIKSVGENIKRQLDLNKK